MFIPPPADCQLCPRLVAFRAANVAAYPVFFNGAVPSFGDLNSQMLVVGLAPGLKGANASGRPFTGDFAGEVLYAALARHGFAMGNYQARADDGFTLKNVRITNAVRCVPPENKPIPAEEKTCNRFLIREIAAMPRLKIILSLGLTSHQAVLRAFKLKPSQYKFTHGEVHEIVASRQEKTETPCISPPPFNTPHVFLLINSYHTSRYNISTRRLTQVMFDAVVAQARGLMEVGAAAC